MCIRDSYAIAGQANGLESDQLRISLTQLDAESGSYITFLTQGEGRQIVLLRYLVVKQLLSLKHLVS